jgi:hypothetical protein
MNKGQVISKLLRALADAIDGLDENELQAMLSHSGLRELVPATRQPAPRSRGCRSDPAEIQAQSRLIMENLTTMGSRTEALSFLNDLKPTRLVLLDAAKLRDVHIQKQDTNAVIMEKLVANVVGSRLDSAAIRGS